MTNLTTNTTSLVSSVIKASKEPFCKDIIEQTILPKFDPSKITDKELINLCQQYGNNSKVWKRKFEELLPEVLKRRLYKNKFVSIYEFAAKLCGMSRESVDNVLRIYKQFEDKPILKSLIVEYGWSKLRIVAGIATKETDSSWAEKVRVLPTSSLVTIVKDFRRQEEKNIIEKIMNQSIATKDQNNKNILNLICREDTLGREPNNQTLICPIFGTENLPSSHNIAQFDHPTLLTNPCNSADTVSRTLLHQSETRPNDYVSQTPELATQDALGPNSEYPFGSALTYALQNISFKISNETHFRLRKLKMRIEKGKKEKISFNQLFEVMLDMIENKEKIAKKSRNPYGITPLKLRRT